jgi:hypothetical protein
LREKAVAGNQPLERKVLPFGIENPDRQGIITVWHGHLRAIIEWCLKVDDAFEHPWVGIVEKDRLGKGMIRRKLDREIGMSPVAGDSQQAGLFRIPGFVAETSHGLQLLLCRFFDTGPREDIMKGVKAEGASVGRRGFRLQAGDADQRACRLGSPGGCLRPAISRFGSHRGSIAPCKGK